MPSLNDLLTTMELGSLKGWLAALLLPPVPFILLVLLGAWSKVRLELDTALQLDPGNNVARNLLERFSGK